MGCIVIQVGNSGTLRTGIIGASGYTGVELLRLLASHPVLDVVYATGDTQAGTLASSLYPSLAAAYPSLVFAEFDVAEAVKCDVLFLGLPHEASMALVPQLIDKVRLIVDLSAAYRLVDSSMYPQWYGFTHDQPEVLKRAVYGLPELYRNELAGASLIATPGCYVTAASLALTPLVRAGVIDPSSVIVDAASGVSGAGRTPKPNTHFNTVDEDFTAYGLLDHRHTPEIEQVTGAKVLFTPHLAPMNRGILATCYAKPAAGTSPTSQSVLAVLAKFYNKEPFVVVRPASPSTKATLGSNAAHITARFDERTGTVMVLCAIDNLTKGASGGAVQAANVALGIAETTGLSAVGVYP
ncbi:MAG: N-acetyl-gamma-glutamyl-phosphate reductase [Actinobacteria bacterium]|nr:N-acetyl-gamma-glutamyl-phosphate reductase [Acidimicrobiia bacterium]NDE51903.1 N-acetyl-gamma-glutamyl-phosphate reductase [Actinomycetota bacterium]NDF23429.1 N-acetyl-gamma-glutamyl-phosphate reductase [Actinomycetota bacterium]NDF71561.1 N-acetyl-gamma-glutamyl-phosphate reductase [Actinomycetota bacterium]NDH36590.1 N-acetyl-gamma-glutamyl-phosphate reductase [Acidimicrobiia bacterium]